MVLTEGADFPIVSPPRQRRTLTEHATLDVAVGFTSAAAENMGSRLSPSVHPWFHLRACGEHTNRRRRVWLSSVSPPRLRRTLQLRPVAWRPLVSPPRLRRTSNLLRSYAAARGFTSAPAENIGQTCCNLELGFTSAPAENIYRPNVLQPRTGFHLRACGEHK